MKNIILLIALVGMFCCTELTLTYFLPLARTDFNVWVDYFMIKDAVYDFMFFLFFYLILCNTERHSRAIAYFGVIMSAGSFIDKVIFRVNQYFVSDIILLLVGSVVAFYIYKKEENGRSKNMAS